MHSFKTLTFLLCGALFATASLAQTEGNETDSATTDGGKHKKSMNFSMGGDESKMPSPTRRWYLGNSFDGAIFSSAIFQKPGEGQKLLPTVRFSLINIGYHFNYDFDEHFGIFTGLGIKNLGFIEKTDRIGASNKDDDDSTIKRRVYTLGIPLGFKVGNLQKRHYFFFGGGVDMPFNYRQKGFVKRNDKAKFSDWMSDRTPRFMPFLFAGISYKAGSTVKLQYYPGNFFNTEYEENNGGVITHPYRGYSAHLLCLTFGLDMHYKSHSMGKKEKSDDDAPAPAEM